MSGAKQGDDTVSYTELYKMAVTSYHDYEHQYLSIRVLKKPGFESYIVILLDQPSDLI